MVAMTQTIADTDRARPARRIDWGYWLPTGLFCVLFLASATLSLGDLEGTRAAMRDLGYPTYMLYPQAIAKLLGIGVILTGWSRTLTALAYAGFLYDLLLALAGHIHEREAFGWVALLGLLLWLWAFWADRRRFATVLAPPHGPAAP
jgi:hypothetical protein